MNDTDETFREIEYKRGPTGDVRTLLIRRRYDAPTEDVGDAIGELPDAPAA